MISQELLKEVLPVGTTITEVTISGNSIIYHRGMTWDNEPNGEEPIFFEYLCSISVYELAFKCKDWAYEKHQIKIISEKNYSKLIDCVKGRQLINFEGGYDHSHGFYKNISFTGESEIETILKAATWVLLELKKYKEMELREEEFKIDPFENEE